MLMKNLKKKKNKDVIKSFVEKWKDFEEQKHEAYVELGFDLTKIIQNDSLRRIVISHLIKEGWRKVEEGGLTLKKAEVYKYAGLKSLNVESLENYVKYYETFAKLELIKAIVALIDSKSELIPIKQDFLEIFKINLKDEGLLSKEQLTALRERFPEVLEEIKIER